AAAHAEQAALVPERLDRAAGAQNPRGRVAATCHGGGDDTANEIEPGVGDAEERWLPPAQDRVVDPGQNLGRGSVLHGRLADRLACESAHGSRLSASGAD